MIIKSRFYKVLFQKDRFVIGMYKAVDPLDTPDKSGVSYFTAKGNNLPTAKNVTYSLEGDWVRSDRNGKKAYTFAVSSYTEEIPKTSAGIIRYLQTLDGVGAKTARRLYETFGDDIFEVLDKDIEQLLTVKGMRKGTYRKIKTCWAQKSVGRELFAYLYKFQIPDKVIMRIFDTYEEFALDMVKKEPYSFTDIQGFGFYTADKIAKDVAIENGEDENSYLDKPGRLKAGILEAIKEYENGGPLIKSYSIKYGIPLPTGNTCIEWPLLYSLTSELLHLNMDAENLSRILRDMEDKEIIVKDNYFYRRETGRKEFGIAKNVARLLCNTSSFDLSTTHVNELITKALAEKKIPARLSDEQAEAVRTAMNNGLSIITGGPGTGKTMIQNAILYAVETLAPGSRILNIAPTGRAARRMYESTGHEARTIHSALGLYAGEEGAKLEKLEYELIIVDESSMIDNALASYLFSAIPDGCRTVIVGDDKQLPSVGPGSVLRELIGSGVVPTSVLTTVFRQSKGSSIGINAKKITEGKTEIVEDDSFQMIEVSGTEQIADKVRELYDQYRQEYDLSELTVLSPYRVKTATGVNALNASLQNLVFPNKEQEAAGFITGDKVMYTKNSNGLTNGEIGEIVSIAENDGEPAITCNFSGQEVTLEDDDIMNLTLAYATTIHKSQGSEYKVVILVMDPAHKIMHKRNLVYTAITRAKQKCIVVGSKASYEKSILAEETENRVSLLGQCLQESSTKGIGAPLSSATPVPEQLGFKL